VPEHRPILLPKNVPTDLDNEIGTNTEDVPIERGMVELAEGKTVGNGRFAQRVAVRQDVGGIEQLHMTQPAHGALFPIRSEHTFSERDLMHPHVYLGGDVAPSNLGDCRRTIGIQVDRRFGRVHRDPERLTGAVLIDDEDWPHRKVPPGRDAVKVDERGLTNHGGP
jgi:hypothetical protein